MSARALDLSVKSGQNQFLLADQKASLIFCTLKAFFKKLFGNVSLLLVIKNIRVEESESEISSRPNLMQSILIEAV